jgi:hypothetical protein
MPNRTTSHETHKLDHSTHPTTHSTPDDLRAPGGGNAGAKPAEENRDKTGKPKNAGAERRKKDLTPSRL